MPRLFLWLLAAGGALLASAPPAAADTCSGRASSCRAACTPQLVSSGEQYGGTVEGCLASCRERQRSCLSSGIWVHMGARRRGMREEVVRR